MPQRIIGIDIGSHSVKVAQVVRSFRTFEFVGFFERRIQHNELLAPEESTAIALQGLIDDHHLEWDTAIAGFPGSRVSSRLLTFPFGGSKKIEQTIRFEIESYIPFDVNEVVLDYTTVWSTKEASRILVVYAQKADVVKELAMLEGVGVDPRSLGVEGVELINLVNLGLTAPEGAYAIIDVGHEKTTVAMCRGRQLGFVRAITIAGKAITQAIAKKLSVPLEEAERLKIEMGWLSTDVGEMDDITSAVQAATKEVVNELLLHLKQTLFTYRDEESTPVEGIYLCGGTSRLPGFDRYLSDELKQNVTFINPTDFHFSRLDQAHAHRHLIPQALALALKGTAGVGTPAIDLRQGDLAYKGDVEELGGSMRHAFVGLLIVIGLALASFVVSYSTLHHKLNNIENDVREVVHQSIPDAPTQALSTPRTVLGFLKGKEGELTEKKKQLNILFAASPLDLFKEISERLPNRQEVALDMESLSIATDRISLSGSTTSFEAVDRIKQSLEKSELFKNVSTGNVRKGVKGEVKFDVAIDLVKQEGG